MDQRDRQARQEQERIKKNKEIVERMKNPNDKLSNYDKMESWWPRRPPIAKDKDAIKKLYED